MVIMNRIQCKSEIFVNGVTAVEINSVPSHQESKSIDSCSQFVI